MHDKIFFSSSPTAMSETRRQAMRLRLAGLTRMVLSVLLLLLAVAGTADAASCCHVDDLVTSDTSFPAGKSSPLASFLHKGHCAGCLDLGITHDVEASDDVPLRKIYDGSDDIVGILSSGAQQPEAASSRRYVPSGSKPGHRMRTTHYSPSGSTSLSPVSILPSVMSRASLFFCRKFTDSTPWLCATPCEYYVFALREIII